MEWNEVVDYLSSRTKLHVLNLEDIKELSQRLEVDSLSPNKFINGNNVGEVFKEVLNTYYYYKSHGKNGFAIESMIEEMKKVQRLERLTAELRAYYLTKLRIKQQIPITPFKKADQKKSQMYSLSLEENSEIAQLRSEVAELRQKINESTSGINRVPSSPRPPIRRKQSNTPERTSAALDSKSLDEISKILLDHDVCISDQKKTLARMTKLCLGALSAIAKLENKILKSDFGNHCSDSESNLISIWENTYKQLKKEIIETKTELSSIAEKVSHCPNGNIGIGSEVSEDIFKLKNQTQILSDNILRTDKSVIGFQGQLGTLQEQIGNCNEQIKMHLSKKVGSEQKFKSSYDNNKEAITKMDLTIGRLISNDLPNLTIRLKDCESTIDKQVSSAEHDVRIDALHKEFEKKYDSLKSDLFNELKNCENVYDDQIKVLREGIECVVSKTEGYIDKNRFENLIENTRKETVELRENMGKIIKQDEENTKNIKSLEQSSTTMAKEIKNCTELSLKKASELENAQKKMDELKKGDDLLLNSVNKLQNQVNGIVKEIKDCQTKGKELSSNLESVKNVFEEERKEEKLNISKLETSLGKTLKSQEKIEKELSSNKDNLAEQVRSKVEFCSDSLKKEINFCKKELNCCRNEVSDMGKDIIKHLEDEKLHINSSFKPFNKDIETMNHKITSCLGDMNKWNKKLDTFHQEFTLGLNKVKDDSISVKKEVAIDFEASLQENSVCLQKMIDSFMKSTEQDINKHNQKIKEIDNENQIMKNKVSEALSGTTFVSKKDLKDIQKNLINDIKSASEQYSGIKADFDDFKLSERSKYTLLDKKQKDINTFCEDINATIYRTEEDIKDIRLDVSVDSNTINELKMKISGINESKDKFEHLSRKVEECFERDLDQTNSFNSFKEDLAQFKSSIQTSSKGVNALEDKYANEFLSVKKRIDGLVTSKKIRDKLVKDVERIDKKLEQYHEKVMDKIDTNKYSFENDLQLSQEKISLSENSIQKLDKRMDELHENEVKSRENIAPLICNFKEAMDANFTYVIQHVMENQKFIDSIRKLMEESTQAESAGKSPS